MKNTTPEKTLTGEPHYFRIKVIPKSQKNEWVEPLADGTLKIRIAAPPEKGKANAELIKFLSKKWNVPPHSIHIISGKSDPIKLIKIQNETH